MSSANAPDGTPKSTKSKSSKKSTKSRAKSAKLETNSNSTPTSSNSHGKNASGSGNIMNPPTTPVTPNTCVTPTTPTTIGSNNVFETPTTTNNAGSSSGSAGGGSGSSGIVANNADSSSKSKNCHKSYAGLDPYSIKIMWEQHDQSDVELSTEVCARLAEDASYKLWECINNIKVYSRHSGSVVTYDLVNEVFRESDVPAALGAMDSDWDRIDCDGSYYFYSDKIIELRDEYQKDIHIQMPAGPDFTCSFPIFEEENIEMMKTFIRSLICVSVYADDQAAISTALSEAAFSPLIACGYRVILEKLIQILAFKQNDGVSSRCWRLLGACAYNQRTRDVHCREEYYHLSEILICQLLAPYESIKMHNCFLENQQEQPQPTTPKLEPVVIKLEPNQNDEQFKQELFNVSSTTNGENSILNAEEVNENERVYKLKVDDDDTMHAEDENDQCQSNKESKYSPYYATPVDLKYVNDLCRVIGLISASSGYFQSECVHHIIRRLERFFEGRTVTMEKEFSFISRAMRGLISLGESAFREFIPFVYKFKAENIPEILWNDFSPAAIFLSGPDDVYLYEWLEFLCGDKLQPFKTYYAEYFEKLQIYRSRSRKPLGYKINPKIGVRRLEWNNLGSSMSFGSETNKAKKPKLTLKQWFPAMQENRLGTIRFKFASCGAPKPKDISSQDNLTTKTNIRSIKTSVGATGNKAEPDILIAKRKLFKPLTNLKRVVPLSSYYYTRI